MIRKYPYLSSSIRIGNIVFKNRMFSAPMGGTDITENGCIGDQSRAFYELRAKGGAGAVTVSECMIHPQTDSSHAYHLDLSIHNSLSSFTLTADAIKKYGSIPSLELSHSGQFAGTYMTNLDAKKKITQFGVSDSVRDDGIIVKALDISTIKEIIESYGKCAALAKRAGFQMLTVHGGHGWLINQFLSPYFNHRNDEYGGNLENRIRFAKEVLIKIREIVGPGFPIEFRMSGSECFEGGYGIEDGIEIAKLLNDYVDLFHISAGTYQKGFEITHPSAFMEHGSNVKYAAAIKKHVNKPVATVGGLGDPDKMEEVLAKGYADIVVMARALLADPFLPHKVSVGKGDLVIKCLRCYQCMAQRVLTGTRSCTVNPLIGREYLGTDISLSRKAKRVIVIGAGPAGLNAAITAAKQGHSVTVYDKNDYCGGILFGEKAIHFKNSMYELGISLEKIAIDEGVIIIKNIEVNPEMIVEKNADCLIVAVGSAPIIPPINGIESTSFLLINDYHKYADIVGENVAIIGGGLAGSELAAHLAIQKKNVYLIEMRDQLAVDANVRIRPILLKRLENNVNTKLNHKCIEISDGKVVCMTEEDLTVEFYVDTIIIAAGQRSRFELAQSFQDCALQVLMIGDCIKAQTITEAMYQGYFLAQTI